MAAVVDEGEVAAWFAGAMAELEVTVGDAVTGSPGGTYDNALFEQGRGHVLVYLPTAAPPRRARVHAATLPAAELAVATHVGEHDGIEVTYGELGTWVVENVMPVAGPVRECGISSADRRVENLTGLRRSPPRGRPSAGCSTQPFPGTPVFVGLAGRLQALPSTA